jgi:mannitol-1-phosphate 5-dehydrogenase
MKKFIMYGAGNIGRGFIGPTFSQSGYSVGFIDINMQVIEYFCIFVVS